MALRRHFLTHNIAVGIVLIAAPAFAQVFVFDRYEQVTGECVDNLLYAETALNEGNAERAETYLSLGIDPCNESRELAVLGLDTGALTGADAESAESALVSREAFWVILMARLGLCEEAQLLHEFNESSFPVVPAGALEIYAEAGALLATCQPGTVQTGPPSSLHGHVVVSPGEEAQTSSGVAGGNLDLGFELGGDCVGTTSPIPSFTMEVTETAWIWVEAMSDGDLTLVLQGPDGQTWCNDDYFEQDPAIYQWLQPGAYTIFVGEYSSTASGTPFMARFFVDEIAFEDTDSTTPTYGELVIGPGVTVQALSGVARGIAPASETFPDCAGQISEAPSFVVNVEPDTPTVAIEAFSTGDLILVVNGPGGAFCNDDFYDLNPAVIELLLPGTYDVYVGEYSASEDGSPFEAFVSLYVAEPDEADPTPMEAEPETLVIGPGQPAVTISTLSGGPVDASGLGGECVGSISAMPNFRFQLSLTATVSIRVTAEEGDTTLVVQEGVAQEGALTYCNDDAMGVNPGLTQPLTPGTYDVYIGSYNAGETLPVSVAVSAY